MEDNSGDQGGKYLTGRTERFKRNQNLEALLQDLNDDLSCAEDHSLDKIIMEEGFPPIFIVGPHRSGTTLIMQWLAGLGIFSYPSNFLSRFYRAPIIGGKIQLMLTEDKYNYRDEVKLADFHSDYVSSNGKTAGLLSPNEFWYFWRRFMPFSEIDYLPDSELINKVDTQGLRRELFGLGALFKKQFVLKALICNQNIPFLAKTFPEALFIRVERDPAMNIQSAIRARETQYGDIGEWYSFKIKEYNLLKDLEPFEQTARQIYYINKSISEGMRSVDERKKITIKYEDFCINPGEYYKELVELLEVKAKYSGPESFLANKDWVTSAISRKQILQYYQEV